jgi:hypothetical protein
MAAPASVEGQVLTFWQDGAAFTAGVSMTGSIGLLIWIWSQCRPRGTEAQRRTFRLTFAAPWRFCGRALLISPLVALAAVLIGSQWFPEYVRPDVKDFIGLWSLIATAAVIFALKAACASGCASRPTSTWLLKRAYATP